jgi:ribosome-associated protein
MNSLLMVRPRTAADCIPRKALPMPTLEFPLDRDHVELHNLLKLVGLCDSGGAGKALVASGAVLVDGEVELRKTRKLRAGNLVEVGEHVIRVVAEE